MARKKKPRNKTARAPLPRSTRHSRGQQPIIDDARDVLAAASQYFKGFKQYDAGRKTKLLPKARLDAFAALLKSTTTLVGGGRTRATIARGTTRAEEKAREVVFSLVSEVRGIVAAAIVDDVEMRKAFLVGVKLSQKSTPHLVKSAADSQQAWEDPAYHARALALGIDKSLIDKLVAARRALQDANTTQHAQAGQKSGDTSEMRVALRKLETETAHVRRVAALAFKGQPKALAAFARKTPKAIARPRKPQSPPPTPPK